MWKKADKSKLKLTAPNRLSPLPAKWTSPSVTWNTWQRSTWRRTDFEITSECLQTRRTVMNFGITPFKTMATIKPFSPFLYSADHFNSSKTQILFILGKRHLLKDPQVLDLFFQMGFSLSNHAWLDGFGKRRRLHFIVCVHSSSYTSFSKGPTYGWSFVDLIHLM